MIAPFPTAVRRIAHDLIGLVPELRRCATTAEVHRTPAYRAHRAEIEALLEGVEWDNRHHPPPPGDRPIRLALWNIERGLNLDGILAALRDDPVLSTIDILLVIEADIGMGRSGNRNVPREIAEYLGFNYAFANSFWCLSKGDEGEQAHATDNGLGLHGLAIVSRFPFRRYAAPRLVGALDYFAGLEKRLGARRALIGDIDLGDRSLAVSAIHLDVKTGPRQRAAQLAGVLEALRGFDPVPQLCGGDFNTCTYDLSSRMSLAASFLYKLIVLGLNRTVASYMVPHYHFEQPVFDVLARFGYTYREFNDLDAGTIYFDLNELSLQLKTRTQVPDILSRWLRKRLEPWDGRVPLRLDWLAGKNVAVEGDPKGKAGGARVVAPVIANGAPARLSDHFPVVVDVRVG